jgi:hypothetical protein
MLKAKTKDTCIHQAAAALGARGGKASAARLTPEQRTARARAASRARWGETRRCCSACCLTRFDSFDATCPDLLRHQTAVKCRKSILR